MKERTYELVTLNIRFWMDKSSIGIGEWHLSSDAKERIYYEKYCTYRHFQLLAQEGSGCAAPWRLQSLLPEEQEIFNRGLFQAAYRGLLLGGARDGCLKSSFADSNCVLKCELTIKDKT